MTELQQYLIKKNEEIVKWVNEDPSNRFSTTLVTEDEHWNRYGVYTPADYEHYQLCVNLYELHKEVYGFKPNWSMLMAMSDVDLQKELDSLTVTAGEQRRRDVQQNRIQRKLRHARHVMWVEKKRSYFKPHMFTVGMLMNNLTLA